MKINVERNLSSQLINSLGKRIASGEFNSGTVLTSDSLQAEFGVSRTVVREALRVLHDKGMTRARTKTGTIVLERYEWNILDPEVLRWMHESGLGSEFLHDVEEVRAGYEPWVARIAARKRGSKDIAALTAALKDMTDAFYKEGPNSNSISDADVAFHSALFASTHNELVKRIGGLLIPLLLVRDEMVMHIVEDPGFIAQHKLVLDAIVDEDPDAAELAMKALLETANKASRSARPNK